MPGEVALTPTGPLLDAHRWLGEPVEIGNLTVWPVHTDAPLDVGEFLTFDGLRVETAKFGRGQFGAAAIVDMLKPFEPLGKRMHPTPLLLSMARSGQRFYAPGV